MQSPVLNLSSTLECPKCGKNAIVSHQSGVYQCLNCNFERDLALEGQSSRAGGIGEMLVGLGGILLTLALFL